MKTLAAAFIGLVIASCATIAPATKPGSVDHVVLVWLKRPGNERDKQTLIELGRELRAVPGIRHLDTGTPLPSDRPIVDDSFDIGYVMRFDSPAALETYTLHPAHLKAKDGLARLSRKVLVYDIVR
jgi:hypothetical protein